MKKLATMEEEELQRIYELTYKYGWIVSEEREKGWLPDRAYLEKSKIESALNHWINYGLDELTETYDKYIYDHTAEGWVERWMEMSEGADLPSLLEALKSWAKSGSSALGEREIEEQFLESIFEAAGGEDTFQQELYEYLGPQFIENHIEEMDDVEDQEKMEEEWEEVQSYYGPEEGAEDFIYKHNLDKQFQEHIAEADYGTVNWFVDTYHISDALEHFGHLIDNEGFFRNLFFNSYVKNFPGLDETVEEVERVKGEIESAKASDISAKIITFQLGLTTAHQFGAMADHLLETGVGSGEKILDEMSSGPHVQEWDRELEQILGPKIQTEQPPEYFTPGANEKLAHLMQALYMLASNDLYHVTYLNNVPAIEAKGLAISTGGSFSGYGWGDEGRIHLTDNAGIGFWMDRFAQLAEHNVENPLEDGLLPVVVRIPKEALEAFELELDEHGTKDQAYGEAYYTTADIPSDYLEIWNGNGWVALSSVDLLTMQSTAEEAASIDKYEEGGEMHEDIIPDFDVFNPNI